LIAFFIAEHGQDEDLLKLTHGFGESHTCMHAKEGGSPGVGKLLSEERRTPERKRP